MKGWIFKDQITDKKNPAHHTMDAEPIHVAEVPPTVIEGEAVVKAIWIKEGIGEGVRIRLPDEYRGKKVKYIVWEDKDEPGRGGTL